MRNFKHPKYLSRQELKEIKLLLETMPQNQIAKRYNVTHNCISKIASKMIDEQIYKYQLLKKC